MNVREVNLEFVEVLFYRAGISAVERNQSIIRSPLPSLLLSLSLSFPLTPATPFTGYSPDGNFPLVAHYRYLRPADHQLISYRRPTTRGPFFSPTKILALVHLKKGRKKSLLLDFSSKRKNDFLRPVFEKESSKIIGPPFLSLDLVPRSRSSRIDNRRNNFPERTDPNRSKERGREGIFRGPRLWFSFSLGEQRN